MPTHLEVIALDGVTYEGDADIVIVPGVDGQLAILPRHAPVVTALQAGEIVARRSGEEISMFVSGGFIEISADRVLILADAAERGEDIDIARAEAARVRAQERLAQRGAVPDMDFARLEGAFARSIVRLKVAERARRRRGTGAPRPSGQN